MATGKREEGIGTGPGDPVPGSATSFWSRPHAGDRANTEIGRGTRRGEYVRKWRAREPHGCTWAVQLISGVGYRLSDKPLACRRVGGRAKEKERLRMSPEWRERIKGASRRRQSAHESLTLWANRSLNSDQSSLSSGCSAAGSERGFSRMSIGKRGGNQRSSHGHRRRGVQASKRCGWREARVAPSSQTRTGRRSCLLHKGRTRLSQTALPSRETGGLRMGMIQIER